MIITGINNIRITHQNGRDVEEAMSVIATYMASATKDKYDKIGQSIWYALVFSEYGEGIENFIQYIPNTTETCYTAWTTIRRRHFLPVPIRNSSIP